MFKHTHVAFISKSYHCAFMTQQVHSRTIRVAFDQRVFIVALSFPIRTYSFRAEAEYSYYFEDFSLQCSYNVLYTLSSLFIYLNFYFPFI